MHPELMEDDPNMMFLLHSNIDNAHKIDDEENNSNDDEVGFMEIVSAIRPEYDASKPPMFVRHDSN